jgi:hypothetical protein
MITGTLIAVFFFVLAIISWTKIRHGKKIAEFIYSWGFPMGAFVWEDMFIFSLYGLGATLITLYFQQTRLGLLFFIVFWLVRSAGETLYFFLEQFLQPKHYPHFLGEHFKLIQMIFGKISHQQCLILMQITFQIIMMSSVVSLIILLFSWNSLP